MAGAFEQCRVKIFAPNFMMWEPARAEAGERLTRGSAQTRRALEQQRLARKLLLHRALRFWPSNCNQSGHMKHHKIGCNISGLSFGSWLRPCYDPEELCNVKAFGLAKSTQCEKIDFCRRQFDVSVFDHMGHAWLGALKPVRIAVRYEMCCALNTLLPGKRRNLKNVRTGASSKERHKVAASWTVVRMKLRTTDSKTCVSRVVASRTWDRVAQRVKLISYD
jgi:hypothetical protein